LLLCGVLAACAAGAGCKSKSTSPFYSSGGSVAQGNYLGAWNFSYTVTNETGTCSGGDPLNSAISDGTAGVGSSGSISLGNTTRFKGVFGTMDPSNGAWSLSGSITACGGTAPNSSVSGSGTCSSFTSCALIFTTNPSGGTETMTVTLSR
jgi:hypothetical protein